MKATAVNVLFSLMFLLFITTRLPYACTHHWL